MPWPFGLFARSRSRSEGADAPAPPPPRASGHEWAGLPPIQRATADLSLTASARAFASSLPGAVGVPLALQPLGHARSLDAPSGLVTGLASPAPTYAGGERMVYVQRRTAPRPALAWPEGGEDPAAGEEAEAPAAEMPPPLAPRAVAAVAALPPPAPLTVSTLPEMAMPVAPPVGSRSAASAPAPPPAPTDDPVTVQPALETPPRRLNVGQSRRRGLGAPLAPAAGRAVVQRSSDDAEQPEATEPPGPLAAEMPGHDEEREPPVQRLVESGRPAPPLAAPVLPASRVSEPPPDVSVEVSPPIFRVQRRAAGAPPVGRGSEPAAPPMPVVPDVPTPGAGADQGQPGQRAMEPPPAGAAQAQAPASGDAAPPPAVVPVQRLDAGPPPGPGPEGLPVLPARPVRAETPASPGSDLAPLPVVPVQRVEAGPLEGLLAAAAPEEDESDLGSPPAMPAQRIEAGSSPHAPAPGADVLPVAPVQRSTEVPFAARDRAASGLAMPLAAPSRGPAGTLAPPSIAAGTPALPLVGSRPLPVSTGPAPASDPSPAGIPGGAAPMTFLPAVAGPPVQRVADAAGPPAAAWTGATTAEAAGAALAPVARSARAVVPAMPVVQPTAVPLDLPYLPAATRASEEPNVQRTQDGQQYLAIEVPVQRAVEAAPEPASTASSGGAAGGAASGSPQHSDKELDDLARQLYERLRSRLRMELLVDRERAGLITDLR